MKDKRLIILGLIVVSLISGVNAFAAYNSEELILTTKPTSHGPVKVEGRQLKVDFDGNGIYQPYLIKGVGYSPYPICTFPGDGWTDVYNIPELMDRDFPLIVGMNANTIRTWGKVTQTLLDKAQAYGLKVCAGFWIDYKANLDPADPNNARETIKQEFRDYVTQFKDHPALLFWVVGNENNLWQENLVSKAHWYSLINEMAYDAYTIEYDAIEGPHYHPVATANGEIHDIGIFGYGSSDEQMTYLDIWGVNVYRGSSFGSLFSDFANKSAKPLWISEFGIDAWDNIGSQPYPLTQAQWDGDLWDEIVNNSAYKVDYSGVAIGATVMEYCDEWWKPGEKPDEDWSDPCTHDLHGNLVPGAAPDGFLNQEYWGIMSISPDGPEDPDNIDDIHPRDVYAVLQQKFAICVDGTPFNQCSVIKPRYCDNNGNLINNCHRCGCGYCSACQSSGNCVACPRWGVRKTCSCPPPAY